MSTYQNLSAYEITSRSSRRWVCITDGQTKAYLSTAEFRQPSPTIVRTLAAQNLRISGKEGLEALDAALAAASPQGGDFIDQLGWSGDAFVLPDGTIVSANASETAALLPAVTVTPSLSAGSHAGWLKQVAEPLTGNSVAMTAIMAALAPPFLSWARLPATLTLEIVAPLAADQGLLELLYGGVAGSRNGWSASQCGVGLGHVISHADEVLADHRDLPLLLRGGTLHLAGEPQSKRLATAKALAHFLDRRPGAGMTMVDQSSIIEQLGADTDIGAILTDKLLTLSLGDAFGLELIESFPNGQSTASGTRAMLLQSLRKHHGTALPLLIARVAKERATNEKVLRKSLAAHINTFRYKSGVDVNDAAALAQVDTFAVLYAIGCVAKNWGVLPSNWTIGLATFACYKDAMSVRPLTFDDRLQALANAPGTLTIGHGVDPLPSDSEVDAADVFVRHKKGGRKLIVRRRAIDGVFKDWAAIRRSAAVRARLDAQDRRQQTQVTLKRGQPKERVYAFQLP